MTPTLGHCQRHLAFSLEVYAMHAVRAVQCLCMCECTQHTRCECASHQLKANTKNERKQITKITHKLFVNPQSIIFTCACQMRATRTEFVWCGVVYFHWCRIVFLFLFIFHFLALFSLLMLLFVSQLVCYIGHTFDSIAAICEQNVCKVNDLISCASVFVCVCCLCILHYAQSLSIK